MTQNALDSLTATVRELLVDTSISERIGLQPGDLNGAAQRARNDLAAGRALEALNKFVPLVLLEPGNIDLQIGLAESALAIGQPELAMQCAAVVIADRPKQPAGYLLSGRAAMLMGEREIALEDLEQAVTLAEGGDPVVVAMARQMLTLAQQKA